MQAKPKLLLWSGAAGLLMLGLLGGLWWASSLEHPTRNSAKPDVAAKPATLVAAGDISCQPGTAASTYACRSADTAALITSLNPDAVLTVGDNQYQTGTLAAFQAAYDKTWGAFKDKTYPVPGNHDYGTPDAAGYFDYFGSRAGERGKGYYSYKLGGWLMIALNSEIDISADSPQLAWLKQLLDSDKSVCALAYWHRPRFTTGGHHDDAAYDAVWRVLYAHGADIVINGHSHAYERFAPLDPDAKPDSARGMTQFVSGMGGEDVQAMQLPSPNLATRQNHAFGVLKLTLYPKSAKYEFVPVPGPQTFADKGTVTCH